MDGSDNGEENDVSENEDDELLPGIIEFSEGCRAFKLALKSVIKKSAPADSLMIGLTKPSSGAALVQGLDIQTEMDRIYTSMGVCPQHDLLWETLTGRGHLLFYGRLKNLEGSGRISKECKPIQQRGWG